GSSTVPTRTRGRCLAPDVALSDAGLRTVGKCRTFWIDEPFGGRAGETGGGCGCASGAVVRRPRRDLAAAAGLRRRRRHGRATAGSAEGARGRPPRARRRPPPRAREVDDRDRTAPRPPEGHRRVPPEGAPEGRTD